MSQKHNSRRWKKAVKIALGCVLALDGVLLYVNWGSAGSAPQALELQRANLFTKAREYAADVSRGETIKAELPQVQAQCNSFYEKDLLPASTGYSVIIADLGQMARDAGVQTAGIGFTQTPVKDRGLNEVEIAATVQGDYSGLIRFLNAMENSRHFYVLDSLVLGSQVSGSIKLNLQLRTYFRT
jgi:type IV pilus assembly protein PilO